MDKVVKIQSQPAKYDVFYRTEASSVISNVTQYRIAENCVHHAHCFLCLSLSVTMDRKKFIMLFSYHNVIEMGLKLEE